MYKNCNEMVEETYHEIIKEIEIPVAENVLYELALATFKKSPRQYIGADRVKALIFLGYDICLPIIKKYSNILQENIRLEAQKYMAYAFRDTPKYDTLLYYIDSVQWTSKFPDEITKRDVNVSLDKFEEEDSPRNLDLGSFDELEYNYIRSKWLYEYSAYPERFDDLFGI